MVRLLIFGKLGTFHLRFQKADRNVTYCVTTPSLLRNEKTLSAYFCCYHSVHWSNNPPQKYQPLFLAKSPLNLQTVEAFSLPGNPNLYVGIS